MAPLGLVGWCPVAIGDTDPTDFMNGIWVSQGNGWSYLYSAAGNYETWNYNGLHRFYYNYTIGQCYDHASSNATYWNTVGSAGLSSAFIADGS